MYRRVAAILFGLIGAACAPELNWREWRSDEVGVAQSFPCKPIRQQRQVRLADMTLQLVLHVCDADGVTWALAHASAPDPATVEPLLLALVTASHANVGAERRPPQAYAVPGATPHAGAGRFTFEGSGPQGLPLKAQVLIYAKGLFVVQLTALGPQLSAEAVDMFFGSARSGGS